MTYLLRIRHYLPKDPMETLTSKNGTQNDAKPEKRKAARHRPRARVDWRALGDPRYRTADLRDIGTGGLALIVDRYCKRGTVVVVQVPAAAEVEPMLLTAEWAKEQTGKKWLVGCSFRCPLTEKELQAF